MDGCNCGGGCRGDCCCSADPATVAQWGCYRAPYIYCDDLGPGGVTQPRHASQVGTQLGQIPEIPTCAADEWFDPMSWSCTPRPEYPPGYDPPPGGEEDIPCPAPMVGSWPNCVYPGGGLPGGQIPGELPPPGVVTETDCAARAAASKKAGKREALGETVKVAAVSAAVAAAVGAAIGYLMGS